MFTGHRAEVVHQGLDGLGQRNDLGRAVDLDVGAVELVAEHENAGARVATDVGGFGPLWVAGHHDAPVGVEAAGHRGGLQRSVGAERGEHHLVAWADEVVQFIGGDGVGRRILSGHHASVFDMSVVSPTVSNMSSNDVFTALDAVDVAYRAVADLPLHELRPTDLRALVVRLEELDKHVVALQRRMIRRLVSAPPPAEFAGASWAQVLSRRLRISVGEAQRRIVEAGGPPQALSA